ncbi:hypothetical protein BH24CHL1_BH24CHL1_12390 [soil metagenome]
MLNRRPFRGHASTADDDERARIQARLDALEHDRANDSTLRFTLPISNDLIGNASFPQTSQPHPADIVETRAYLLTDDGGILAELPCDDNAEIMTIGRGKTAEIRINDPYVHRLQAKIRWDDAAGAHYLAHGGGENGTYINRHQVQQPYRLHSGESLRFGKTELVYRIRR